MTDLEAHILDVLRNQRVALDHEAIWLGFFDDFTPEAVRRALNNLKRRGEIRAVQRGFYVAADSTPEGEYGRNFREAVEHIESLPPSERAAASNRSPATTPEES